MAMKVEITGDCSQGGRVYAPGDVVEGKSRDLQPLVDAGHARVWAEPWELSMPPEDYLRRYPDGPNAELAARHLTGASDG